MEAIKQIESKYRKPRVAQVQSGDTVRVHQLIREGAKQRVQVFEGLVIRTHRMNELTAVITVRRIASGVGVEKTFLLHSPNVQKVEVVRRSKVRRNFLSYQRGRRGKAARLQELAFDKAAANVSDEELKAESQDEQIDADVTEISEEGESVKPEESLDEEIKEENREAEAGDPVPETEQPGADDENTLPAQEAQSGVDKAGESDKPAGE
jgi:large subunit ribosomal protein L19